MSTLDLANLPRTDGSEVDFAQDFFGREAFLTVSRQLNVEAYCLALTKVYTFGPTFRADKPAYGRVLDDRAGNRLRRPLEQWALAGALLRYTLTALLKEREDDPAFFDQRIEKELVGKLEAPGSGEIISGGQREEQPAVLDERMAERGIDKDEYAWYRDLRRCSTVPHAGFGPRLRAHPRLRHRPCQRARRYPLPAHPLQRKVLTTGPAAYFVIPKSRLNRPVALHFSTCFPVPTTGLTAAWNLEPTTAMAMSYSVYAGEAQKAAISSNALGHRNHYESDD